MSTLKDFFEAAGYPGIEWEDTGNPIGWLRHVFNDSANKPDVGIARMFYNEIDILRGDLPERTTLPQNIQDFLDDVSDLPMKEKLDAINQFVNGYITYEADGRIYEWALRFEDVVQKATGDCDDYTTMKIGLARYAGIPANQIHVLSLMAGYTVNGRELDDMGHAVAIIEDDSTLYVLDNNMEDAEELDTSLQVSGKTPSGSESMSTQGLDISLQMRNVFLTIPIGEDRKVITFPEEHRPGHNLNSLSADAETSSDPAPGPSENLQP